MTTVLATGYNVVKYPCTAQALGRAYVTNDFDIMRVSDDGVSLRTVGITAPSSALAAPTQASGNCDVGAHLLRYRWEDTLRGRLSNPSDAITVTVTSSTGQLTVTNITSADSTVNQITYEMCPVGASTYYRVTTSTNTAGTVVISISDANMINSKTPSSTYGDFGHGTPPLASIMLEHRQRLYLWGGTVRTFTVGVTNGSPTVTGTGFSVNWAGKQAIINGVTYYVSSATTTVITLTANYAGTTNASIGLTVQSGAQDTLYWSRAGYPESWDAVNLARRITLGSGDKPAAMFSMYDDLYLVGQRSIRRLIYDGDPGLNGRVVQIPNTMGAFNQRCIWTDASNMAFGWGRDGIWMIDAMQPKKISDPVDTTIAGLMDSTQQDARFLVFEPSRRVLLAFFCLTGETSCRAAAAYHVATGQWQIWRFRQGMKCGCINSNYLDRARLMVADVNGYSWRVGTAKNDGIDNGVTTAGSGSTTSAIVSNITALAGETILRPATSETSLISSVGSGFLNLTTPFATTPTAGEAMWVGSIQQHLITSWHVGDTLLIKNRPRYLLLSFRPTGVLGTLDCYYYVDFSSNAAPLTSLATDTYDEGVSILSDHIHFDLDKGAGDGFVALPLIGDWRRAIRAEIYASTPGDGVRFWDVTWAVDPRKDQSAQASG